jgi:hypothetical protein
LDISRFVDLSWRCTCEWTPAPCAGNSDTYREYCRIEAVTGYSFRKDFWLSDVKPDLLPPDILNAVHAHKINS